VKGIVKGLMKGLAFMRVYTSRIAATISCSAPPRERRAGARRGAAGRGRAGRGGESLFGDGDDLFHVVADDGPRQLPCPT
jgi:hypothetical protein